MPPFFFGFDTVIQMGYNEVMMTPGQMETERRELDAKHEELRLLYESCDRDEEYLKASIWVLINLHSMMDDFSKVIASENSSMDEAMQAWWRKLVVLDILTMIRESDEKDVKRELSTMARRVS